MERVRCGACGRATARVYAAPSGDGRGEFTAIELRCKCGVRTRFVVPVPVIVHDREERGSGAGNHCIGWREKG